MVARVSVVLFLLLLGGCRAATCHWGRSHVSDELLERTGYVLAHETNSELLRLPPNIDLEDGVSEREAVSAALWNNAAYQELLTDLGFTQADLIQASQLTNPQVGTLIPIGPKQFELTASIPLEALWLRPWRIAAAEAESQRVAERLVQNGLDVVRDVRVAYSNLTLAQDRARLAAEAERLRTRIAQLAEARLQAGDASALEVATTRIDALRAREEAARVARDVALAKQRLQALMGLAIAHEPLDFRDDSVAAPIERDTTDLVNEALAVRPDLRAAELAMEAACKRAALTRRDILTVGGLIDMNKGGGDRFEIGPGFQWAIPIFHRNEGAIARSDALVEQAAQRVATTRDRIAIEVQQAHTEYLQASEDLVMWRTSILPEIRNAVDRAEKAYRAGDAALFLVLETTRQLIDAQVREVEVDADLRRARAELERSVGRRLVPEPAVASIDSETTP